MQDVQTDLREAFLTEQCPGLLAAYDNEPGGSWVVNEAGHIKHCTDRRVIVPVYPEPVDCNQRLADLVHAACPKWFKARPDRSLYANISDLLRSLDTYDQPGQFSILANEWALPLLAQPEPPSPFKLFYLPDPVQTPRIIVAGYPEHGLRLISGNGIPSNSFGAAVVGTNILRGIILDPFAPVTVARSVGAQAVYFEILQKLRAGIREFGANQLSFQARAEQYDRVQKLIVDSEEARWHRAYADDKDPK